MHQVIWEYKAKPKQLAKFEELFSPKGERVKLFKQSGAFQGSELLLDDEESLAFISIDFWTSAEEYEQFLKQNQAKIQQLNEKVASFTKINKQVWI